MTGTALTPADRAVRPAIYRSFAGQGRPPSAGQIAAETGLAEADVGTAMRNLPGAGGRPGPAARPGPGGAHPACGQQLLEDRGLVGDFWRLP